MAGRNPPKSLWVRGGHGRISRSPHVAWQLDYDYVGQLNAEEREWLSRFTEEYYLSCRNGALPDGARREAWRSYKRGQKDVMSRGDGAGKRSDLEPAAAPVANTTETHLVELIDAKRAKSVPSPSPADELDALLSN